jgi:deoxyribodipyrimidine photo-lyase
MTPSSEVPALRVEAVNDSPVREDGRYVLYWMTACRRLTWSFSLDRAVEWAQRLSRPLVILEAIRCDYQWANDRLHAFALQGMADNQSAAASLPVRYYPYVERQRGEGRGLLASLAQDACLVVADDAPFFFLPRMLNAAGAKLAIRLEKVDSNGLLPLRATSRVFSTAHSFRVHLQKHLRPHLEELPRRSAFSRRRLPGPPPIHPGILARWPVAEPSLLSGAVDALRVLPLDHTVAPARLRGGTRAARRLLAEFVQHRLSRYLDRNQPDADAASGLSPYLHWGHISAHEVFAAVAERESWSPARLGASIGGAREGWWKMSAEAEAFLDQLVTWRELGFNMAKHPEWTEYKSLPGWARSTLSRHASDARTLYSRDELEQARTSDELWNAAQTQLVREGVVHNYLRMLWGKRVLEWTRTPEEAFAILEDLNNKYALDGRDPNSYSGILWVFGRYDRPWGPERSIFGTVRYMSSENTRRKLKLKRYLETFGARDRKEAD